jgi:hypothetical protein
MAGPKSHEKARVEHKLVWGSGARGREKSLNSGTGPNDPVPYVLHFSP